MMLSSDQVPAASKSRESFFPGCWEHAAWGFGVSVAAGGPHRGRWGSSGGPGTDFFVDPDGTLGLLLPQVEIGPRLAPLLEEYGDLTTTRDPLPPR
ncbi:hypothetical protein [Brachybacterium vulturis]|uniref:hypothetical protein n=1 Tax=Brachybacterium vulturis TaxID=2017484 RepID=UPI003735F968